jgi:hypothetical protein
MAGAGAKAVQAKPAAIGSQARKLKTDHQKG